MEARNGRGRFEWWFRDSKERNGNVDDSHPASLFISSSFVWP